MLKTGLKTVFAVSLIIGLVGCADRKIDENPVLKASNGLARTSAIFGYRQAKVGVTEQQMLVDLEKVLTGTALERKAELQRMVLFRAGLRERVKWELKKNQRTGVAYKLFVSYMNTGLQI